MRGVGEVNPDPKVVRAAVACRLDAFDVVQVGCWVAFKMGATAHSRSFVMPRVRGKREGRCGSFDVPERRDMWATEWREQVRIPRLGIEPNFIRDTFADIVKIRVTVDWALHLSQFRPKP